MDPRPKVHLMWHSRAIRIAVIDELGEFRFNDVPNGPLRLQVDVPPNLRVVGDIVVAVDL